MSKDGHWRPKPWKKRMMFLLSLIYIGCGKSCKIPSKYNFGFKKNFSNMSCNIIKILLYRFKNSTLHFYSNISKSSYMWWLKFNSLAAGYKVFFKKMQSQILLSYCICKVWESLLYYISVHWTRFPSLSYGNHTTM